MSKCHHHILGVYRTASLEPYCLICKSIIEKNHSTILNGVYKINRKYYQVYICEHCHTHIETIHSPQYVKFIESEIEAILKYGVKVQDLRNFKLVEAIS